MLDIPKLGMDLLNRIQTRIAEQAESAEEFEDADQCVEGLKGLVNPQTEVKQALTAQAENGTDYVRRERDIMHSLMETEFVRRMM